MIRPISATSTATSLRQEIAVRAARLIAEEGMDYAGAKRKAARDLLGAAHGARTAGDWMPDNAEIEAEVRVWQGLFQADSQPARLAALRRTALNLMRLLAEFRPYLTGAALNGTATEHSDIHLHLFPDSPKDVSIFLLNQGIAFEAHETPRALHGSGRRGNREGQVETLSFMWQAEPGTAREGVHLVLYDRDDLRGALTGEERGERAGIETLERLLHTTGPGVKTAESGASPCETDP